MSKSILGYRMSGDTRPLYAHRQTMQGAGFWGDLWDGVKSVAGPVIDIARKTGAISKIANATGNPEIGAIAGSLGFGKRKRRQAGGKRKKRTKASKMVMKV